MVTKRWLVCAPNHRLVLGDDFRIDNIVVFEETRRRIVTVTRDEPKLRSLRIPVYGLRREGVLRVMVSMIKLENARRAVVASYRNEVTCFELAEVCEDAWTSVCCIDVSQKDGGSELAGRWRTVVPPSWGAWTIRRHFHGAV